jgi:KUP system potassium uptake protein
MSPGGAPEISTDPPRRAEEELGESRSPHKGRAAVTLAALGVVFGDIGTSPLYAFHTVFAIDRELRPTEASVYGVISLVFWAITLVVTVKYVTLIMRADNHGEGGIMALIALVRGIRVDRRSTKLLLVSLGIFGAALFYGDGMITPAISMLSAVEGLEVAAPSIDSLVVPITLTIVAVLFAVQRFGTGVVGRAFGPVMAVWFAILAV